MSSPNINDSTVVIWSAIEGVFGPAQVLYRGTLPSSQRLKSVMPRVVGVRARAGSGRRMGFPRGLWGRHHAACPQVRDMGVSSSAGWAYAAQSLKPTGSGWRQTARPMRRTMRKRLARPDRVDAVTRTMVVTRAIVNDYGRQMQITTVESMTKSWTGRSSKSLNPFIHSALTTFYGSLRYLCCFRP